MSCTAMGAWVYDDPSFALQSVAIRPGAEGTVGADSVDLVFVGCNLNDYDLMGQDFTTRLAVGGRTVGMGGRDQPVFFATRDTSLFTVTLALSDATFTQGRGPAPFELTVHSALNTPIGNRALEVRLRGKVAQTPTGLTWFGETGRRCHPGSSQLPGVFDRRGPVGPPHPVSPPPPQPPRNGPGLRPDPVVPPIL